MDFFPEIHTNYKALHTLTKKKKKKIQLLKIINEFVSITSECIEI